MEKILSKATAQETFYKAVLKQCKTDHVFRMIRFLYLIGFLIFCKNNLPKT